MVCVRCVASNCTSALHGSASSVKQSRIASDKVQRQLQGNPLQTAGTQLGFYPAHTSQGWKRSRQIDVVKIKRRVGIAAVNNILGKRKLMGSTFQKVHEVTRCIGKRDQIAHTNAAGKTQLSQ